MHAIQVRDAVPQGGAMTTIGRWFSGRLVTHIAFLVASTAASIGNASSIEVNTCGQVVGGKGFLSADLDCTGFSGDAVTLEDGASLDLAGHTLTGGQANGVRCPQTCTVLSDPPGGTITACALHGIVQDTSGTAGLAVTGAVITANGQDGIHSMTFRAVKVSGATISGNGGNGVLTIALKTSIADSTITGNAGVGVAAGSSDARSTLTMQQSTVSNNGQTGALCTNVKTKDVNIVGNGTTGSFDGVGSAISSVKLKTTTVSGNTAAGVRTGPYKPSSLTDCMVTTNTGAGVTGYPPVRVRGADVSNNGGAGISLVAGLTSGGLTLIDSTVTGNAGVGASAFLFMKVIGSVVSGNSTGLRLSSTTLDPGKMTLVNSAVTNNAFDGIVGDEGGMGMPVTITVTTSSVKGNANDPSCNVSPLVCADVVAKSIRPEFDLVPGSFECNTSFIAGTGYQPCGDCPPGLYPGLMWGICLQDCQNGVLNGSELCDDGGESTTCDRNCTPRACGDLTVNAAAGEDCDDGNTNDNDACKNDCTFNVCGDGVVRTGFEQCDDGNTVSGDGCSSTCQIEP